MRHFKHMHMPSAHSIRMETSHWLQDPRFWAVLAMVLLTILVLALAFATRPGAEPIAPGPYIY